jgi:hypothetical protein
MIGVQAILSNTGESPGVSQCDHNHSARPGLVLAQEREALKRAAEDRL